MGQSTITAEGGTVTLSTAPDGEITASSADFAVYVVQQVEGGGGGGVTEYATLAELIIQSEGSLDEGYYTVAETPSVTHPLYPRIVTYWDGADFEPQISTGFENRPALADAYCVWDAIENKFRTKPTQDQNVFYLPNQIALSADDGLRGFTNVNPSTFFRGPNCEVVDEGGSNMDMFRYIPGSGANPTEGTIILAGSDLRSAGGVYPVIAAVGSSVANLGIAIFNRRLSVESWGVGWWILADDSPVAPRSIGDVVILSYDATGYDLWVNGAKILTRSTGMTIGVSPRRAYIFNDQSGVYNSHGGKIAHVSFGAARIDDAGAAEWTAWLQDRYGIATL